MATKQSSGTIQPDIDDLDGQVNNSGAEANGNGTDKSGTRSESRTIDGKPVTSIDGIAGDNFARDDSGNILRNKDGSPRRKRGRRAGSGNGNSGKSGKGNNSSLNDGINTLSQTLLIMHQGLANFMKFEDMALSEDESKALAQATVNVMEQFDFAPDPRFTAVAGLVTTASMIYGPRYIVYKAMKKAEKNKAKETGEVFPLSMVNQ